MTTVSVKGLADLQRHLDALPAKIEANIMAGAVRAAANELKDRAKANCPVGNPSEEGRRLYGHYRGALRDSIRVTTFRKDGRVYAVVKAGGKSKKGADVWYAHLIEFTGAKPHRIKPLNKKVIAYGGKFFKYIGKHPGMKRRPFMRPALYEGAADAVKAAGEYIKRRLMLKNGIDTSDVNIGGEA